MANELILIVEDDPNSRKLLRDVLHVKGYRTLEAVTAEEGLAFLEEELPAAILMDIQLPGISGVQALQRIRAVPRTQAIPVIAVTASVMQAQTAEMMQAGFNDLERKPISVASLLGKLKKLIDTTP